MSYQTILALTDFSSAAEHALDRAALLAARRRASLRLLYADEVPSLRFSDPFARLQQRARQLARRHGIVAEALAHNGDMVEAIVRHAARSDLLVLDPRSHRAWHAFWRGTTLDQLMRRCPCPMLVVRRAPCGPYRHLLVDVDLNSESKELVRYASGFEGESAFEFFHALSTFSEPGMRSDLVVVGRHRNSTLVDFLCGSVARRVVSLAGCDVLVVCHDYKAPSGAAAKNRIQALLNDETRPLPLGRHRVV